MPSAIKHLSSSNTLVFKAEGAVHGPPYNLPVTGGWLGVEGTSWNWWQKGYNVRPYGTISAMVEACVSAYSQTVAMCPGDQWRTKTNGGRERVTNSALSRILRQPNDYQSISDFLLNMVRDLYLEGNAYALCLRNSRYEINELHPMRAALCWPQVAPDGSIFYSLSGNTIIENRLGEEFLPYVPARDVLHIKLHSNQQNAFYPLLGASPLLSAALDIAAGDAIKAQQLAFFTNQARPSFVLTTDLLLEKDQVDAARDRWNDHAAGLNAGGTVILTGGLKPMPISMRNRDSQIAEVLKMSDQDIALVFRIPFALLGIGGAPHGSTEVLMNEWVASGLGFCLNHVEEGFGQTFDLDGQPDEYVEFSTEALLRSAFKDRIAGLKDGVLGGIYSPDEARNKEGLSKVPGGHGAEPRLQAQVVPLSAAEGIPVGGPGKEQPKIPPAPSAPAEPAVKPGNGSPKDAGAHIARYAIRHIRRRARSHARPRA